MTVPALAQDDAPVAPDPARAPSPARSRILVWLGALFVLPMLAHLAFSRFGFNPTDDGFILASSRRLLDGQVPHRDFISVRPVGSALLHMPWVAWAGAHTFLVGRMVAWFEFAIMAWATVQLGLRLTGRQRDAVAELSLTIIAFVLATNTFPIMPWHTIDALTLTLAGLALAARAQSPAKIAGYFLLGAAALCRQNFLAVAPVAAFLLGDRRRWSTGVAIVAPLAFYAAWLVVTGAVPDAIVQLGSQSDLDTFGFRAFLRPATLVGAVLGYCASRLHQQRAPFRSGLPGIADALIWIVVAGAVLGIPQPGFFFLGTASYLLFGAAVGAGCALAMGRAFRSGESRLLWLTVLVSWSTAVSIGMNSPALATGVLAVALIVSTGYGAFASNRRGRARLAHVTAVALVICALGGSWVHARTAVIYRDRPAAELDSPLGAVLDGAHGIVTGPRTFAVMADLDRAVAMTHGARHAVVADFAAHWVASPQSNPVAIDWAQSVELNRPELRARVEHDLESLRGRGFIIVQKIAAGPIANRYVPLFDDRYYCIPAYVRAHFRRTAETEFFAIYQ